MSAPDGEDQPDKPKIVIQPTLDSPVRSPMPMISATGIVVAMVKTPQGLLASACTTTSASTASKIIMIASTLTSASAPTPRPISSFTIWPSVFPRAPHGSEKHDHVVHAAAERRADQNPKRSRQKTKLRRQHRTDQRTGPGDGGEMMTECHPAIRRHEILAVILHDRGRRALVVQDEDFGREPFAVKTIADRRSHRARDDDPERADLLAAGQASTATAPRPSRATAIHSSFFQMFIASSTTLIMLSKLWRATAVDSSNHMMLVLPCNFLTRLGKLLNGTAFKSGGHRLRRRFEKAHATEFDAHADYQND